MYCRNDLEMHNAVDFSFKGVKFKDLVGNNRNKEFKA